METRHILISDGPALPRDDELDKFWTKALLTHPELDREHQIRSIGIDEETTDLILGFVKAGTKVATFSLPWVMEANGFPASEPGTPIVLCDYRGAPRVVVRLTAVREIKFADIGPEETGLDGPPVQDPAVWLPLHRTFWDGLLERYGKRCTDDMPVLIEPFEFVFADEQHPKA